MSFPCALLSMTWQRRILCISCRKTSLSLCASACEPWGLTYRRISFRSGRIRMVCPRCEISCVPAGARAGRILCHRRYICDWGCEWECAWLGQELRRTTCDRCGKTWRSPRWEFCEFDDVLKGWSWSRSSCRTGRSCTWASPGSGPWNDRQKRRRIGRWRTWYLSREWRCRNRRMRERPEVKEEIWEIWCWDPEPQRCWIRGLLVLRKDLVDFSRQNNWSSAAELLGTSWRGEKMRAKMWLERCCL